MKYCVINFSGAILSEVRFFNGADQPKIDYLDVDQGKR